MAVIYGFWGVKVRDMEDIKIKGFEQFSLTDAVLSPAIAAAALGSDHYPYDNKMKKAAYEKELYVLHIELQKLQSWVKKQDERVVILFEGRDSAGKGGTIKRFTQYLNPRSAHIVALGKPDEKERGEWYFQRYIRRLPTTGEMAFYDRSWYNRAGVERVMGFCTPQQTESFFAQVTEFEALLKQDGIRLFKIWLNIGQAMQLKRFHKRRHDPLKHWKLSPIDLASLTRWDDYTKARDEMFARTHNEATPWLCIKANDKRRARLAAIKSVLQEIPYDSKAGEDLLTPDPKIVLSPEQLRV